MTTQSRSSTTMKKETQRPPSPSLVATLISLLPAALLLLVVISHCSSSAKMFAITTTADATAVVNQQRECYSKHNQTIQISGSWLEFCPCGMQQIDATDGNDNGCISIQVAKVTTTDTTQKVFGDIPATPFSSTITKSALDPTTGEYLSGGTFLPIQQSGQNFFGIPLNTSSALPNGGNKITMSTWLANYGTGASLTGVLITTEGFVSLNNGQSQQLVNSGDRLLYVRCKENRDILAHNIYLRIKVFGQASGNIVNYADFLTRDFLKLLLVTDTMTPPQQIPFVEPPTESPTTTVVAGSSMAPSSTAGPIESSEPPLLTVSNVFGQNWLRVTHMGDKGHVIQNSMAVSPTFVFGIQLAPLISLTATSIDQTTFVVPELSTTPITTPFEGGAPSSRRTTPIPAAAPNRLGAAGSREGVMAFVAAFFATILAAMMV